MLSPAKELMGNEECTEVVLPSKEHGCGNDQGRGPGQGQNVSYGFYLSFSSFSISNFFSFIIVGHYSFAVVTVVPKTP